MKSSCWMSALVLGLLATTAVGCAGEPDEGAPDADEPVDAIESEISLPNSCPGRFCGFAIINETDRVSGYQLIDKKGKVYKGTILPGKRAIAPWDTQKVGFLVGTGLDKGPDKYYCFKFNRSSALLQDAANFPKNSSSVRLVDSDGCGPRDACLGVRTKNTFTGWKDGDKDKRNCDYYVD